jgi:FtsP/CotA-like multicopper oxidase with cupredoxin domain
MTIRHIFLSDEFSNVFMARLFQSLRRLLIVALAGMFISINTFTGEAVADGTGDTTKPFTNQCTLTPTKDLPAFQNPPFAYADKGQITLDATYVDANSGEFQVGGKNYSGYLYGGSYYDVNDNKQTFTPSYNPPTIVVSPGNSIDLKLTNDLPVNVELDGKLPQIEQNLESVSQDTNLHYHGFNVSPLLGSDDVVMHVHSNVTPKPEVVPPDQTLQEGGKDVVKITTVESNNSYKLIPVPELGTTTPTSSSGTKANLPGGIYPGDNPPPNNTYQATTEYDMEVNLPKGHQSGLFWYHPHVHTVSDNQVRAGMSGGIIVTGIEDSYTFLDPTNGIKPTTTITPATKQPTSLAITQQVMMFKDFNDVLGNQQTPPDCFTLNGQLNPQIKIQPGEVQFWRIANIGADTYLNLALEDITGTPTFAEPNGHKNFYILARDSDVVKNPVATDSVLLPPASRVELLVVGGTPGQTYTLVSDLSSSLTSDQQNWVGQAKSYYLATVSVEGSDYVCYKSPDGQELTPDQQNCNPTGQTLDNYITSQKPAIIDDLLPDPSTLANYTQCKDGVDHTKCITPSGEYPDEPLTQKRYFYFSKPQGGVSNVFTIEGYNSSQNPQNLPPGELYDENRIDKVSHLGDIEEWQVINATGAAHAFHMHQLDFLVTQVILQDEPTGDTYDNYNIVDGKCKPNADQQTVTCPLEPQGYRDTMNLPPNSQTTIRIPFLNPFITGVFVYHCHILNHEDKGMMQNLKVIDPKQYKSVSRLGPNS